MNNGLDGPVLGAGNDVKFGRDPVDCLVMIAVYHNFLSERQESVWFRVNGMTAFNIAVGIADILKKRTAEKNVNRLMPPAYSQQRLFLFAPRVLRFAGQVCQARD